MTTDAEFKAVESVIDAWIHAANANDPDAMAGLVAEQFEMIPPGAQPAAGAEGLDFLRSFFEQSQLDLECETTELVVSGDLAFQRYVYRQKLTPKSGGEPQTEQGHGIHLLQRQRDGSWKFTKDIWTTVPQSAGGA